MVIDTSADPSGRARFIADSQPKARSQREATKSGRVVRARIPFTSSKTWPGIDRSRRHHKETDIRNLLEHLVIASHAEGGSGSEENSEETDGSQNDQDIREAQHEKAELIPFFNWGRKGTRMRKRDERARAKSEAMAKPGMSQGFDAA